MVLDSGGYDGCLCSGDWSYDARRTSGFARSVSAFLEEVGLVSVWENFGIDFTYVHTDHKSTSILDNLYVNSPRQVLRLTSCGSQAGDQCP